MEIWGQVVAGVILLALGGVGREVWRKMRGQKDPPTAEDIATARIEIERQNDDKIHAVASEIFDLIGDIRSHSSTYSNHFERSTLLDRDFDGKAVEVERRWRTVEPKLSILRRDDIPRDAERVATSFVSASRELVDKLRPYREAAETKRELTFSEKEALPGLAGAFISIKYEGETLQREIEPYRTRLHPRV